ncbi:MAG: hypothetical protein Q9191_006516 [Dirinaria sp. TL-2023a]
MTRRLQKLKPKPKATNASTSTFQSSQATPPTKNIKKGVKSLWLKFVGRKKSSKSPDIAQRVTGHQITPSPTESADIPGLASEAFSTQSSINNHIHQLQGETAEMKPKEHSKLVTLDKPKHQEGPALQPYVEIPQEIDQSNSSVSVDKHKAASNRAPSSCILEKEMQSKSIFHTDAEYSESTSSTDASCQEDAAPAEDESYTPSGAETSSNNDQGDSLSQNINPTPTTFVPAPVGMVEKESLCAPTLDSPKNDKINPSKSYQACVDNSAFASAIPHDSESTNRKRLGDEALFSEVRIRDQQQTIATLQYNHGAQLREIMKNHQAELQSVNDQKQLAQDEKKNALERLREVESQLRRAQSELEAQDRERKQKKSNPLEHSTDLDTGCVSNASLPSFHQWMTDRGWTRRPDAENLSLQNTEAAVLPESQLEQSARKLAHEKSRSVELEKELDQALSLKDTVLRQLARVRMDYEVENNKVSILMGTMQDEPAKTAEVDKHLKSKDAAYRKLEQQYGDSFADNAELQRKLSISQENAEWKNMSFEKKLATQEDIIINKSRTVDLLFQSNDKLLAMFKETTKDQECVDAFDDRYKIVVDHNRLQGSQISKLRDRESEIVGEVLSLRAGYEAAKAESTRKSDEIAELGCLNSNTSRELERLKLDISCHEEDLAAKDKEIQSVLQDSHAQLNSMTTLLYAKGDAGLQMLLHELKNDYQQLQNCFAQLNESHKQLEHKISVMEQTRARDEESSVLANEAHECNTSRMIAAEEQVESLIKQFASRDPPTNERLWQQWRASETARIEAREALEKARTSTEDLRALGIDLALWINRIGEHYRLEFLPGTEIFEHYQILKDRIAKLLNPTEEEKQKLSPSLQAVAEMHRARNQDVPAQSRQPAPSPNGPNKSNKKETAPEERPKILISPNESETEIPQTPLNSNSESEIDTSKALIKYQAPDPVPAPAPAGIPDCLLTIDPKHEYSLPLIDTYREEEARQESPVLAPHQKLIEDREGLEADEEWDVDDWAEIVC